MIKSLKFKLIITFTLIILLSIATIDYVVLTKYIDEKIEERKIKSFATANIIADLSRYQLDNMITLRTILFQYTQDIDGRVLLLNKEGEVIADSFHDLEGETIPAPEVKTALQNEAAVNLYSTPSKIMQLAVPIIVEEENQNTIVGAVLVSLSIEDLETSLAQLRWQVIAISLISTIVAIGISILAALRLSRPITKLTIAAQHIAQGNLGTQVRISGKDEIARFANTFNEMSQELAHIDENRRNFISSASHELRTPLASIKALIQPLLQEGIDIETQKEFLGDIDGEIDRLTKLITSLLTLTKMEELKLKSTTQTLKPIVDRVIHILTPIARENQVSLVNDLPSSLALSFDQEQLTEVFLNLMENSIKYKDSLKKSYVLITLKEDPHFTNIIIQDNGIGMDNQTAHSIFKPFYRADHSRARSTGGYGLGLSIIYRIIELHNWSIQVDSIPQRGSTFLIKIPNKKNCATTRGSCESK